MIEKIGIIGNGPLVVECIKCIREHEKVLLGFVILTSEDKESNQKVISFCEKNKLNVYSFDDVHSQESLDVMKVFCPDLIFNIDSFVFLKKELINIPSKGIINFHIGLLPDYRGVNIPSWVILNEESRHGVTWHFVSEEIDEGDIVAQSSFKVSGDTTAGQLLTDCVIEGVALLRKNLSRIVNEQFERRVQVKGEGSYFSAEKLPKNGGEISLDWSFNKINVFVRALNYLPYKNIFVPAILRQGDQAVVITDVSVAQREIFSCSPGRVLRADQDKFWIVCKDCVLSIDDAMTLEGKPLLPVEILTVLNLTIEKKI